jgi:riboflavin kinase/FMN adenylyltransferase
MYFAKQMKIYYHLEDCKPLEFAVVTSGTFDGVHFGHQKILHRLVELSKQYPNAESVLLTYFPHPRLVLFPDQKDLKLLTTLEEKIAIAQKLGIQHFVIIPFTKEFSTQSSRDFIEQVLVKKLNTKKLVIGYDHKFGKNREGSFEYLKQNEQEFGFSVEEIPAQEIDEIAVSSTKIRKALENGDIELANEFLGFPYVITGTVIKGKQLGRTINFPTANIVCEDPYKLIPAEGIYAVFVSYHATILQGMLYIGRRSTLGDNLERTIEVNIFDFDSEIYGEKLSIHFIEKLRGEEKFESLEAMQTQLALDKINSITSLNKTNWRIT